MAYLHIKNVGKTYPNGKQAIANANIDIDAGEFVVFVGPSGCGKSTLLRMVAGLESITEGEMLLADARINDLEPAERDIAMVFQNYALYPHMTVYKNLAYGLINRKFPKAEIDKRVRDAGEMLQLSEYLQSKPSELSGGQRQRVAMGRAIVREPKLFLFDEPLSNLDAKLRNTMRLEIKSLQRRLGITSIYVTHDQVEAMTMADKIVILSAGKVEQIGTPQDIYHNPANLFVATFMGSPAMNILDATWHDDVIDFGENIHVSMNKELSLANDANIKVGLRPETIKLVTHPQAYSVRVDVDIVEDLGAQRIVHAKLGTQALTINTTQDNIATEQAWYAALSPESVYVFDANTGENVSATQQNAPAQKVG